jgi:F-type H+-transporting ATPase subunit delta
LDAIVAKAKLSREVRNLVAVLVDHRRIMFLGAIVKQFEQDLNQRLGFAVAEITSARDLSDGERHNLESEVEKLTGKKVRASYAKDESILGGAMVKIGSTIYDGSVKGQLERMKQALSS